MAAYLACCSAYIFLNIKEYVCATASVTSKGQITIPADIRRVMGLKAKDRMVFTVLPDGTTVMRAETKSAKDLAGFLKPKSGKRVPTKDLGYS